MKKLIIVLVLAVMACGKDDPGLKYTSLEGEWVFTSQDVDMKFTLVSSGGSYKVSGSQASVRSGSTMQYTANVLGVTNNKESIEMIVLECSGCDVTIKFSGLQQIDSFAKMKSLYTTYSSSFLGIRLTEIENETLTRSSTD